ncbi:hypothetical protein [Candidatus Nitrosotenuis cloacae]|uniref:hypothetical protein n=1 Tax=Candidatus Nitrosotenuis cloacae TaxID=1603555 RepID=UPI0022823B06|nr:hypothetical protein [Candidatus Nitrosotenuis cloacae]
MTTSFSEQVIDFLNLYYAKPTELLNVVYIVVAIFAALIGLTNFIKYPNVINQEITVTIIMILMVLALMAIPRLAGRTNKKVIELKKLVMIYRTYVDSFDILIKQDLLNSIDLAFTNKNNEAFEKCKKILKLQNGGAPVN